MAVGFTYSKTLQKNNVLPRMLTEANIKALPKSGVSQGTLERIERQIAGRRPATATPIKFTTKQERPHERRANQEQASTIDIGTPTRTKRFDRLMADLTSHKNTDFDEQQAQHRLAIALGWIPDLTEIQFNNIIAAIETAANMEEAIKLVQAAADRELTEKQKEIWAERALIREWYQQQDRYAENGGTRYDGKSSQEYAAAWSSWSTLHPAGTTISFGAGANENYKSEDVFNAIFKSKKDFPDDPNHPENKQKSLLAAAIGIVATGEKPKDYDLATQAFATEELKGGEVKFDRNNPRVAHEKILMENCLKMQTSQERTENCIKGIKKDLKTGEDILPKLEVLSKEVHTDSAHEHKGHKQPHLHSKHPHTAPAAQGPASH